MYSGDAYSCNLAKSGATRFPSPETLWQFKQPFEVRSFLPEETLPGSPRYLR
jgi:hypothetical protein